MSGNDFHFFSFQVWVELLDGILMPVAVGFLYLLAISDVLPEAVRVLWSQKHRQTAMPETFFLEQRGIINFWFKIQIQIYCRKEQSVSNSDMVYDVFVPMLYYMYLYIYY